MVQVERPFFSFRSSFLLSFLSNYSSFSLDLFLFLSSIAYTLQYEKLGIMLACPLVSQESHYVFYEC